MKDQPLSRSEVPGYPCRRGKVRDVYDLGERLVIVATDRISAFDWVLPTPIPDKGRILSALTCFWFEWLGVPNHLLSTSLAEMPEEFQKQGALLAGRTMLVRKTNVVPIECVVRGFLSGSGWRDYRRTGKVCGIDLPPGMQESDSFPQPIFTPATKAETGHDENISFAEMANTVGGKIAAELRDRSIDVYQRGAAYARDCGILIADTKFEWGCAPNGEIILIDEVFTPDSSRFWPKDGYRPGSSQPSFDKQFVRDWLDKSGWDKNSPPPALPEDVAQGTREKYLEALRLLTGHGLENDRS
jgi:phosphoribosylaminoimidazole-succinocarboxamide synthase